MTLRLVREPSINGATMGCLFLNGHFSCFTLEDEIREGVKIPGETCIPAGRYNIILCHSDRFDQVLPLLLAVSQFDGIRIHAGNTVADTAGCILVGKDRVETGLRQSRVALEALMATLRSATEATEPIAIEIENPRTVAKAA